jgi:hypothetical protein
VLDEKKGERVRSTRERARVDEGLTNAALSHQQLSVGHGRVAKKGYKGRLQQDAAALRK